jgi:hypothetical protein
MNATNNKTSNESNKFVGEFAIITAGKHKNSLGYIELQSEALGGSVGIVGSHENTRFETLVPHGEFMIVDESNNLFGWALVSALGFYANDIRSKVHYIENYGSSMSEADVNRLQDIIIKRTDIATKLKITRLEKQVKSIAQ